MLLLFLIVSFIPASCRKTSQPSPPTADQYAIWPGDPIPGLVDPASHPPLKINIGGVVKNAVAVKKDAPVTFVPRCMKGTCRETFAAGVVPGVSHHAVTFTVSHGGKVLQSLTIDPGQPAEWQYFTVMLAGGTDSEHAQGWVVICSDGDGAYIADLLRVPGPGRNPSAPRVVLFILVDAMRADALGVYGAAGGPSPNIDRLAREGAVFTHTYTSAPFTMTSVATIFTGLYPWQHRVLFEQGGGLYLDKSVPSLVEKFREAGYYTAAFSGTYFLFSRNGFAQGFDHFDETCAPSFFRDSADCINARVKDWLQSEGGPLREGGRPLFLYVHYVDTHAPYYAPEPYRDRFTKGLAKPSRDDTALGEVKQFTGDRPWYQFYLKPSPSDVKYLLAMYEGEVNYVDDRIGELLQMFKDDDKLVLITADHGESFYEHGKMEHVEELHDPVMRVPFILSGDGVAAGKTIDAEARTMDYMPTLLALAGIKVPDGISGRSLVPLLKGEKLPAAPAAALHFPDNKPEYTLVLWPWKLFARPDSNAFELYRLDTDPGELHDLSAQHPKALADMKAILDSVMKLPAPSAANPTPAIDPKTMKDLHALGYW